jgi:hypothetical protein
MKNNNFILLLFIFFIISCNKEDDTDFQNEISERQLDFTNDIIDDGLALKGDDDFVNKYSARSSSYLDAEDTDGDGIADYAESNIVNLDPNRFDDLLSMDPSTILTISTVDGIREVPLYQTSFYQEKMLEFDISSFNSNYYAWTDTQKERVRYYFYAVKKIWLTSEFQDYVKDNFDNTKATNFLNRYKTVKRNVQFRFSRSAGTSNRRSYIGIAPWVMSDRFYRHSLPSAIAHELVHHLGFRHNGIPYGTQNKARQMIQDGKADYMVFDINKKTNYIKPCTPFAVRDNNNYHSMHFLKIPNTGINLERHWGGDYHEYSTPVTFNRGSSYSSITKFLNGGRYSIWIDFNDDAVFDASEQLLNNVRTQNRWVRAEYNFSIPENANTGVHRLRIIKSTYHPAKACRYIKGQAIDFTNVSIQ